MNMVNKLLVRAELRKRMAKNHSGIVGKIKTTYGNYKRKAKVKKELSERMAPNHQGSTVKSVKRLVDKLKGK